MLLGILVSNVDRRGYGVRKREAILFTTLSEQERYTQVTHGVLSSGSKLLFQVHIQVQHLICRDSGTKAAVLVHAHGGHVCFRTARKHRRLCEGLWVQPESALFTTNVIVMTGMPNIQQTGIPGLRGSFTEPTQSAYPSLKTRAKITLHCIALCFWPKWLGRPALMINLARIVSERAIERMGWWRKVTTDMRVLHYDDYVT